LGEDLNALGSGVCALVELAGEEFYGEGCFVYRDAEVCGGDFNLRF